MLRPARWDRAVVKRVAIEYPVHPVDEFLGVCGRLGFAEHWPADGDGCEVFLLHLQAW